MLASGEKDAMTDAIEQIQKGCEKIRLLNHPLTKHDFNQLENLIPSFPLLKSITFDDCKTNAWNAFFNSFRNNTTLTELRLFYCPLPFSAVEILGEALAENHVLKILDLQGSQIGAQGAMIFVHVLKVNTTIEKLELTWDGILDDDGVALGELIKTNKIWERISLKWSNVKCPVVERIAEALKENTVLKSMNLEENNISAKGAMALFNALKVNTTIEELDITWSGIVDDGGIALGELLKLNKIWSWISARNSGIKATVAIRIAQALRVNTILTFLDLRTNLIGSEGAMAIFEALRINATLEILCVNLGDSFDADDETGVLRKKKEEIISPVIWECVEALKVNKALKELVLTGNLVAEEEAMVFVEVLKINTTLDLLNLPWCRIVGDGGVAISNLIRLNRTPFSMRFSPSKLTATVLSRIFEAFRENRTTKSLDIRGCSIENDGAVVIAEAIQSKKIALENVSFTGRNIDFCVIKMIAQALVMDRTFIFFSAGKTLTDSEETELQLVLSQNDVLLQFFSGCISGILPVHRMRLWSNVREDCISYHQLFENHIGDCGGETWRFTRALFRARKELNESKGEENDTEEE